MNKSFPTVVSFSDVMLSSRPTIVVKKSIVANTLITLLTKRLKELGIIWVPSNFRQALASPKLPADLLEKLVNLVTEAEMSDWKISKVLVGELDETVEDIESFNPAYRAAMKKEAREARRDVKLISAEELRAELNAKR